MNPTLSSRSPSARRFDLDWLRVLAVLLVLPFHSLLVFVQNPNSVVYMKDTIDCYLCDKIAGFIDVWHMPLLFLIAGMSTAFALRKRSSAQYLGERVTRLLVPLLFGVAVLVPPMTYLYRLSQGASLSFWQHYAGFFTFADDLTGRSGTFTPAHLWFIMFLFMFSLIALPLFLLLKAKWSQGAVRGMAWFFEKPLLLLVLGLPIAAGGRTELLGATNPVYFLVIFITGYLMMTDERYQKAIDRDWPLMLVLAVTLEVMRQTGQVVTVDNTPARALRDIALEFNRWTWVLAILGIGRQLLNRSGKVLDYLCEAAYPFYLLHFLVLATVTYFVVRIPAGVAVKYPLIVAASFAIAFALYEGARRIAPLRFLLGMKTHRSQPQPVLREEAFARSLEKSL